MIKLILIISLFCNGLYIITAPGMLLNFLRNYLEALTFHHPKFVYTYKPLLGCIKCMASVWGIVLCLFFLNPGWYMLWYIPVVCICSSALNAVIYHLYA